MQFRKKYHVIKLTILETCSKGLQSDDIDDKLGDLFIRAELPFTFVKLEEFATFCAAPNPHYTVPPILKLKNRILKNTYIESDKSLRDKLNNIPFVTVTIDGWSSRLLISMMGIIVHYYVETIHNYSVLSMEMFEGPHLGRGIANLLSLLVEIGLLPTRLFE